MSGNGWCTHPDRQVSSDVRILVRKAELACRNAWGSDLWVDANADEAAAVTPPQPPRPEQPIRTINVSYDDEITSVVSTGERALSASALDDEVVEQSTIRFEDDDYDEQDERRDLLYRDSRSAIERARQRHMQRRHQPVMPDEDTVISHGGEPYPSDLTSRQEPVFEPDDYVEDETPRPATRIDEHDDALLSEGVRTPTPRSLRLRRLRDERPIPKKDPTATKIEPEPDAVDLELPPSAAPERGRFDSIPEVSADIDLPLLRRSSSASTNEDPAIHGSAQESVTNERALKRAHDIHAAARAERDQERRRSSAIAPLRETPGQAYMPDLPDTVPTEAEQAPSLVTTSVPGTSAILHPRPNVGQAREPDTRARMRLQPPVDPQPHVSTEQSATPAREARRSWWRGTRRPDVAEVPDMPVPVSGTPGAMVAEPAPASIALPAMPGHNDGPAASEHAPGRLTLDLDADEGMDSFRDRLFASAPVQEETTMTPRRTPIAVARRQPRPAGPVRRSGPAPGASPMRESLPVATSDRPAPARRQVEPDVPAPARRRDADQRPVRQVHPAPAPVQPRPASIKPEMLLEDPRDAWYEPEPVRGFDVRKLVEEDNGLLDMTIKIAPDVPRACATCRNYRPSEQEGRGWCTNEWAFTHRQMVNETDLACDSTIGCWWLPADSEIWLEEFGIAADATPRVDRLLAHLNPERRAVGN